MRALPLVVRLAAMLGGLGATPAIADWKLERDVEPPSYAVIEPESSNLNIDSVVLACEEAGDARVLQLQIYPSTAGPLLPEGAAPQHLKGDQRAEIAIDGRVFSVGLLFGDTYVVLADETDRMFPRLSEHLIDAIATGKIMLLRFDLLAKRAGQPAPFDGEAVIVLQPGNGRATVSAVRRCVTMSVDAAASGMIFAAVPALFWTRDKDSLSSDLRCGTAGLEGAAAATRLDQYMFRSATKGISGL